MIRIIEDVGSPLVVTGVDLLTTEMAPDWNEYSSYILTGIGYIVGFLNLRFPYADFVKNLGPCSLPQTAHHIYNRVKGAPVARRAGVAGAQRMALRSVSRHPASRQYEPEFKQSGAHAF